MKKNKMRASSNVIDARNVGKSIENKRMRSPKPISRNSEPKDTDEAIKRVVSNPGFKTSDRVVKTIKTRNLNEKYKVDPKPQKLMATKKIKKGKRSG